MLADCYVSSILPQFQIPLHLIIFLCNKKYWKKNRKSICIRAVKLINRDQSNLK